MQRSLIGLLLCLLPAAVPAQDEDDGYGKWEIVTEMRTTGSGGNSSFSQTTTECRYPESIEERSSQWTMNECQSEEKSGGGKSMMKMRCERDGGDYEETVTETTADQTTFKTVTTATTVAGGDKNVMATTVSGRRLGPCDE